MKTSAVTVLRHFYSVIPDYQPSFRVLIVSILFWKETPCVILTMAYVTQHPDYKHVKDLLHKSLKVDKIVKNWAVDEVDTCLKSVAKNVLLVPSSKALRKKSQREQQTFHDGVPATVVGTGAESLILKRDMCDEMERYMSYLHKNWPEDAPVSASKLAKAGFFYIGTNDTVQCFSCTGRINNWDHGDTAMGEHKRLFPKCKFVRGTEHRNVPYSGLVDGSQKGTEGKLSPKSGESSSSSSSSSQSEASGAEDDLVRILKPLTLQESKPTSETLDCFRREINRLLSFRSWPIASPVDRYDLASAGFYCVNDTTVQCFACFGRISEWKLGDRPRDEHRRLFPSCPFISGLRTDNVPLSASEKSQAIKHFAQSTSRESQPHQISANIPDFQRMNADNSALGRTTHPLQLVTSREPTDLTVKYAKYPDKAYEQARLETYYRWPISHSQIPANLARAGFFATGNGDEVKCFYCGGGLKDWDEGDDPWEEHARWFTRCEWLLQQRGPGFVDIVRRKFSNQSHFEPNMGIPGDQNTTRQPMPPPEDTPYCKGEAQKFSSSAASQPAAKPKEEGRRKKGDKEAKKPQPKKQVEKKRQTKKTKSLEERVEEAFQSDVAQFMIDMGQDERIVRTVIRKRLQSGQKPYENSEDLLTAIFEEEASQTSGATGTSENLTGLRASSSGEDNDEKTPEKDRQSEPEIDPDFDEFLTKVSQYLTKADVTKLCTLFDFTPATTDMILAGSKPAKMFLLQLWKKEIIQPDDVLFLYEALSQLNLHMAAKKLQDLHSEMTSGASFEQFEEVSGDMQSEELEKLREKNLCKICLDNDVEMLFLPCKHLVTCSDCANRIDSCPICREPIDERIYVYMP